jgi:hypothetical protein
MPLPYIIARAAVDFAYSDATIGEGVPHVGLRLSDYHYFGEE